MPGTLCVLIILPTVTKRLLIPLAHLAIASVLAKRNGLKMSSVEVSTAVGLAAKYEEQRHN